MKISEDNYETIKNAEEITGVDSGIRWFDAENIEGYIDAQDLLAIISDLIVEYHRKEEELEDKENYCKEWHQEKKVDWYDQYGISKQDFV